MTRDQMHSMPSGELIDAMAKEINTGNPASWVTEAVELLIVKVTLLRENKQLALDGFNLDNINSIREWSF
jgi:hypothetical protein